MDEKPGSSSKELDRHKGDRGKECSSRERISEKTRDKAERHRNKDKDRERERDRERDRHSRDKGRSRPDKEDKYS